jgi:hypothetical protein
MSRLTLEEAARARTWNLPIAATILGPDVPFQDLEHDRHWDGLGGFSVDRRDGAWWCFGTEEGGYSAVGLARFLLKGSAWEDAVAWVRSFITAHPGTGPCDGAVAEDDASETRARISAYRARQIIADRLPIDGTGDSLSEQYLRSLGCTQLPYPPPLYRLPNARAGEEALVVDLVASGRRVAAQLTYVDALGQRSVHQPARRRFNLEPYRPDAVIPIAEAEPGTVDVAADRIFVEGLEKGLAVYQVKEPGWAIIALPGIGALRHQQPARPGERVIIFRDGDPADSPAAEALQTGVDALLLAGAVVRVTETPLGESAKSLLQDPKQGKKALRRLLAKPAGAALSFDGKVTELVGLPETEYEKARKAAAKAHGVRVGYLDKTVEAARKRLKPLPSAPAVTEEPPWTGDIDLAAALDSGVAVMPTFLTAPAFYFDVIALWTAASYLIHDERLAIPIIPQLAFQSIGSSAGKSTALEIVATLACRGRLRSSYTASTVFRKIHLDQTTFCLVDLHNKLIPGNLELQQIVQACHRRAEALVDRTVILASGEPEVRTYNCWAALAWGSIGPMRQEVQNRAIVLPMRRALPAESAKLSKSSPGRSTALIDARRHLAAWSPTVVALPQPEMPTELHNRDADNWRVLFAVARLAGGDWPARVNTAAKEVLGMEHRLPLLVRLLRDIKTVLDGISDTRIETRDLIAKLLADDEAGWDEANRGRPITPAWLRERLSPDNQPLLDPAHSQRWDVPDAVAADGRRYCRGYTRAQFTDAFQRYLPNIPAHESVSDSSAPAAASVTEPPDAAVSGASAGADEALVSSVHPPRHPPREKVRGSAASSGSGRVGAVGADENRTESETSVSPSAAASGNGVGAPIGLEVVAEPDKSETKVEEDAESVRADPAPVPSPKRSTRHKPRNGELGLPPPPVPPYQPGALEEEVRRLHRDNPKRSVAWLGKQTGQPRSVVQAILQSDGGAQ